MKLVFTDVSKDGMLLKEVQFWNMFVIVLTADVLNRVTDCSLEHPKNVDPQFVTFAVEPPKTGPYSSETQLPNMFANDVADPAQMS
mgnify:FL=1